jgi:hypothetical protein
MYDFASAHVLDTLQSALTAAGGGGAGGKRRACKRLLPMCMEAVIDTSAVVVTGLRLGLPAEAG